MEFILHHYIASGLVAWAATVLLILLFNHIAHLNDHLTHGDDLEQHVVNTVNEQKGRAVFSPSSVMATTAQG